MIDATDIKDEKDYREVKGLSGDLKKLTRVFQGVEAQMETEVGKEMAHDLTAQLVPGLRQIQGEIDGAVEDYETAHPEVLIEETQAEEQGVT